MVKTCLSKYGCHGNVKVDGQRRLMSKYFQINLEKVIKFGGYSFNGLEVTNLESGRGLQKPPRPPGLDRVKVLALFRLDIIVSSISLRLRRPEYGYFISFSWTKRNLNRTYNPGQKSWDTFGKTPQICACPLHPQCNVDLKGPSHPESLQALST